MLDIYNMIYVDGNILSTMINLFVFAFILDFVLSFARAIMQIGNSASS